MTRFARERRPVLVVTRDDDVTADRVIAQLHRRGVPVMRFDLADFPHALRMTAGIGTDGLTGRLTTASRSTDLQAVRSLYYRRPTNASFDHLDLQDARFASAQARFGLGGVLASLPGCLYVNHPQRVADAEFKPAQLAAAVAVGLAIPETLVTNDLADAHAFLDAHDRAVYKPLRSTAHETAGVAETVWVREVEAHELDDTVTGTAHMFQRRVNKLADLRITVVGERAFAVRIDSRDQLLDWRTDYDQLSYTAVEPPSTLASAMRAFLARFGLLFGCFDFALTAEGPVFLECNPNGQWAWMVEPTGLPMTEAFADLLEGGIDGPG